MSSDALDVHQQTVLAGLLHSPSLAYRFHGKLRSDLFPSPAGVALARLLLKPSAGHDPEVFRDRLASAPRLKPKARAILVAWVDSLCALKPSLDAVEHAVNQLIRHGLRNHILESVLGAAHASEEWRLEEAVEALRGAVYASDVALASPASRADLRSWASKAPEQYEQRKAEGDAARMSTGFPWLDKITGGARAGQLWVWGGGAKSGKTQTACQMAYAFLRQRKNVLWIAVDSMDVEEVVQLFAVRHSHDFIKGGVPSLAVTTGELNADQEDAYRTACEDMQSNEEMGALSVWKPEAHYTVEDTFPYAEALHKQTPIHAMVWDYIELMPSRYPREQYRLQVGLAFRAAAAWVKSFQHGEGVFGLALHQMSRDGIKEAEQLKRYELRHYAEGAGVERAAHLLGWTLRTRDMRKTHDIKLGVSDQRSGPDCYNGVYMKEDFEHAYIGPADDAGVGASPDEGLDSPDPVGEEDM